MARSGKGISTSRRRNGALGVGIAVLVLGGAFWWCVAGIPPAVRWSVAWNVPRDATILDYAYLADGTILWVQPPRGLLPYYSIRSERNGTTKVLCDLSESDYEALQSSRIQRHISPDNGSVLIWRKGTWGLLDLDGRGMRQERQRSDPGSVVWNETGRQWMVLHPSGALRLGVRSVSLWNLTDMASAMVYPVAAEHYINDPERGGGPKVWLRNGDTIGFSGDWEDSGRVWVSIARGRVSAELPTVTQTHADVPSERSAVSYVSADLSSDGKYIALLITHTVSPTAVQWMARWLPVAAPVSRQEASLWVLDVDTTTFRRIGCLSVADRQYPWMLHWVNGRQAVTFLVGRELRYVDVSRG